MQKKSLGENWDKKYPAILQGWDKKYPAILQGWDRNWSELSTYFEYLEQIRYLIYTTNAVEAYHQRVRKFTKSKSILPTDDAIRKVIFLSIKKITKKWTQAPRAWGMVYSQLKVFFSERFAA